MRLVTQKKFYLVSSNAICSSQLPVKQVIISKDNLSFFLIFLPQNSLDQPGESDSGEDFQKYPNLYFNREINIKIF